MVVLISRVIHASDKFYFPNETFCLLPPPPPETLVPLRSASPESPAACCGERQGQGLGTTAFPLQPAQSPSLFFRVFSPRPLHGRPGMKAPHTETAEGSGPSPDDIDKAEGRVFDHRGNSLSSGASKNPAPPPPSPQRQLLLLRLLAVTVIALLWELLLARWRVSGATFNGKKRLVSLLLVCCFLVFLTGKTTGEEKLAVKVHRKLREKLEDSFKGGQSVVNGVWIRLGFATEVGFGLTAVSPPSTCTTTTTVAEKEESGGGGTAVEAVPSSGIASETSAGHLLAVRELSYNSSHE